jgi:tryptophan synthase beta chain
MEAALRTAADTLTGKSLDEIEYHEVRGTDGFKEAVYNVAGMDVKVAVVSGLNNANELLAKVKNGEADYHFIAVEPESCPSLSRGKYVYDYCDTGRICPLAKMYTLGSGFIPAATHAGGLRFHGMSSVLSELYDEGLMEARTVKQTEVFAAAEYFARIEGILPAPESSHAIKVAIDEAVKCRETGEEKVIVFGLTGTGYFDMMSYEKFHDGRMTDYTPTDDEIAAGLSKIPKL